MYEREREREREKWLSQIECPYFRLLWFTLNLALIIQCFPLKFYISHKMFSRTTGVIDSRSKTTILTKVHYHKENLHFLLIQGPHIIPHNGKINIMCEGACKAQFFSVLYCSSCRKVSRLSLRCRGQPKLYHISKHGWSWKSDHVTAEVAFVGSSFEITNGD
jgi:hypothetical protein